jgi:hypothetical protein
MCIGIVEYTDEEYNHKLENDGSTGRACEDSRKLRKSCLDPKCQKGESLGIVRKAGYLRPIGKVLFEYKAECWSVNSATTFINSLSSLIISAGPELLSILV